jgi:hypothetical protein
MIVATLAIWSAVGGQALAQATYDNRKTPEGWAWARIKEGKQANFNVRCRTPALDPRVGDETGWTNSCRRLSATFLVDVLTRAPWRDQVPFSGVSIIGARIVGDIDLRKTKMNRVLLIEQSRIENSIALAASTPSSLAATSGRSPPIGRTLGTSARSPAP